MRKIPIFLLSLSFFLSGCASFKQNYGSVKDYGNFSVAQQGEATFSIENTDHFTEIDSVPNDFLVKEIRDKLLRTGAFSAVSYAQSDARAINHFIFRLNQGGAKFSDVQPTLVANASVLFIFPVAHSYSFDIDMIALTSNIESYAVSDSAKMVKVSWLPMLVLSPVFNSYFAKRWLISDQIDYLINEYKYNKLKERPPI